MRASGDRHNAREYALRILYGFDIHDAAGEVKSLPPIANWWEGEDRLNVRKEADLFAMRLVKDTQANRDRIDPLIKKHAQHWRIERMSLVDRNILRLAVCEFLYHPNTPVNVIVNEALELAKCYGDDDSPRFINGLLDPLAKDIRQHGQDDSDSTDGHE